LDYSTVRWGCLLQHECNFLLSFADHAHGDGERGEGFMRNKSISDRNIQTWSDWEVARAAGECTEAEVKLVEACMAGRQCELGNGTRPDTPATHNEVHADLLRYLIKGGCNDCDLHDWGVDIIGAYVVGDLDLRLISAVGVTGLIRCHFDGAINAMNAKMDTLNLNGSSCHGLNAQGAEVKGTVFLNKGFQAKGEVRFSSAQIGGQLICAGGHLENAEGHALSAEGIQVQGDVFLAGGFQAKGAVSLAGALIGGDLACGGGRFENAGYDALDVSGAEVKGDVFLVKGFLAHGEVDLSSAAIGGLLACSGGRFENAGGSALNAEAAEVMSSVFFRNGFLAKGEVSLSGATIGGQISCAGGGFENEGGHALNVEGAEVKGSVFLSEGFEAKGEVRLSSAKVGGQLDCSSGNFINSEGDVIDAQSAEIGSFHWRKVSSCNGDMNLMGAKIQTLADDAESWAMVGRAYLDGFTYQTVHGPLDAIMRLNWLDIAHAYDDSFSPQPYEQLAWALKRMGHTDQRVTILVEKEIRQRHAAQKTLRSRRRLTRSVIRLSRLQDEASKQAVLKNYRNVSAPNMNFSNQIIERFGIFHNSWPQQAEKEGFHPSEIARAQAGFREELFWEAARTRRTTIWLQIKDRMARYLVGYGYRPINFIWSLAGLILAGWLLAHQAYERGDFAPNSDVILSTSQWQALAEGGSANPAKDWSDADGKGRDYETFSSFAYAVDVVIPIIAIGQEAAWAPSTNRGPWGQVLWWSRWVLTILGWIVTAVGAAAIAGMIRRE